MYLNGLANPSLPVYRHSVKITVTSHSGTHQSISQPTLVYQSMVPFNITFHFHFCFLTFDGFLIQFRKHQPGRRHLCTGCRRRCDQGPPRFVELLRSSRCNPCEENSWPRIEAFLFSRPVTRENQLNHLNSNKKFIKAVFKKVIRA